ncbi:S8/S53 family peptidase [Polymorphospora sp. NPDC050346]|uniref:S8 family peptidase n=1 Tax=Polymorphospora sp. NPDC050346 TaxID=3155780 RepID=UPI0033F65A3B
MSPSDDRLAGYHHRRQRRLRSLPRLRSTATRPDHPVWYVADELLVVEEDRRHVERYLTGQRREVNALGDEEVVPGLRRYFATGLDVPDTVRTVRGGAPRGAAVLCPNHVFLGTPFNHGGPCGPPVPAGAAELAGRPHDEDLVSVAIVDTGVWADSKLPAGYYRPGGVDVETETDVDNDGLLDGDVGHANFIAGVIVRHAPQVELSVLKVLDTFGVCTEEQLVRALGRLDPTVQIVNLSLGGFTEDDLPPVGMRVALENVLAVPDRVVVAAAGNNGNRTSPFWPAAFAGAGHPWSDRIVAVAAHDGAAICDWSNAGPWVTLAAHGQDIHSTFINHDKFFPSGWAEWSGTSFATPRVVAEIAGHVAAGRSPVAALRQVVGTAGSTFDGYIGLP